MQAWLWNSVEKQKFGWSWEIYAVLDYDGAMFFKSVNSGRAPTEAMAEWSCDFMMAIEQDKLENG